MASAARARTDYLETVPTNEAYSSGVSWAAVAAGAFATSALSLILLTLGTGIGLSSISPWANTGLSASGVGTGAIVWVILAQIIASGVGGYLAGRLRTKWVSVHTHEVYFRDTAHGFLVWSVGLVITAVFFASGAASLSNAAVRNTQASSGEGAVSGNGYFVDSLFRTDRITDRADASVRTEAGLILANSLRQPALSPRDANYLAQLVTAKTGLNQSEAERRVSDVDIAERQAADEARKTVAHSLYWLFVALLIGAFCASYAATIGGRQRDHVPA